jgi:hypothetical protein
MVRYALAILIFAGCADSKTPSAAHGAAGSTSGNAGKGASLSAAGQDGAAGARGPSGRGGAGSSASGGAGAASGPACRAREDQASLAVAAALAGAEEGCTTRADCEYMSIDTECHAACGALVSRQGKAAVERAIAMQNAGVCADYEEVGCTRVIPPCLPPQPFDCVAGVCREGGGGEIVDGGSGTPDAGEATDASGNQQGCLERALSWGPNGGFVAYQDRFYFEPCNAFRGERMGFRDPGAAASCENDLDPAGAITTDDVDGALAHSDVQAAIAAAPVLYGVDSRPVDGTVFRIEIADAVIELGRPCSGSPCRQIPAGLTALRAVLEELTEQQLALDGCEELRD